MIIFQSILFLCACYLNSVMDSIVSNDSFKDLGYWFSLEAMSEAKHKFKAYLIEKGFQDWSAQFIAYNIMVVFLDCFHFSKFIMIGCFSFAASIEYGLFLWMGFSIVFSFIYSIIRKL